MDFSKLTYFLQFFGFLLVAQCLSITGQFITLPYKNLTMWQAYTMALPFAWLDWMFLPVAIHIATKHELFGPNHFIFLTILIQFTLTLIVNRFYMNKKTTNSDLLGFIFIFMGFVVSYFYLLSKSMGWKIPEMDDKKKKGKKNKKNKDKKLAQINELESEEII